MSYRIGHPFFLTFYLIGCSLAIISVLFGLLGDFTWFWVFAGSSLVLMMISMACIAVIKGPVKAQATASDVDVPEVTHE